MQKFIISLILSVFISSTFAGDKPKLDPVQKKYKMKIEYLNKQHKMGLAKIKKLMLRD